jgi:hypothetical protein
MADELNQSILTPVDIESEMKKSYLDYAMSVIVARAIPDVRDGLKPVQRRILRHERPGAGHQGATASARRSAATPRQVPPARRSLIYPTLVRLAQDFNMRYMLVDGQGNFGSVDGDPPGRDAVHRSAPLENRRGNARRSSKRRRWISSPTSMRRAKNPSSFPRENSQPAGQWFHRHRCRHGHQHPAAQPEARSLMPPSS